MDKFLYDGVKVMEIKEIHENKNSIFRCYYDYLSNGVGEE